MSIASMRTCTDCGETKPLATAFTPIKGTPYVYGRCKACRAARSRGGRPPRSAVDHRTCSDCGQTKPLTPEFFLPIKGQGGFYGRCRLCRNARAKARYWSSEEIRASEIARAQRNVLKRRILVTAPDSHPLGAAVAAKLCFESFRYQNDERRGVGCVQQWPVG